MAGTPEDFTRVFNINTLGVMLCYKHAALQMIKQGRGGRIIGMVISKSSNYNALIDQTRCKFDRRKARYLLSWVIIFGIMY